MIPNLEPSSKPRVLILLGCYLPGFRSGGPVRTISAMVEALSLEFDFYIITLNHDSGSPEIYGSVRTGEWNNVGGAQVFYVPKWSLRVVREAVRQVQPDVLYLNGFFATSSLSALAARKLRMLPPVPTVIATRGDLAGGALGLKSLKKRIFMSFARAVGLYSDLSWHASSEREKSEMLAQVRRFGVDGSSVCVAPDLADGYQPFMLPKLKKSAGTARFVTLGRITRMKNLPFAIDRLSALHGDVSLDIFGPIEDPTLWQECERKIAKLPTNVAVNYRGSLDPSEIMGELSQRHFFILPTLGENYGHVIVEGTVSGCPVIISDRTQWLRLEDKRVGWDIALEDISRWNDVLQACVDMSQESYAEMSDSARRFGLSVMNSRDSLEANFALFRGMASRTGCGSRQSMLTGASS